MPRPKKCRSVCELPRTLAFSPDDLSDSREAVILSGSAEAAAEALAAGKLDFNPDVRCDHHDHHGEGHTCGPHGCGRHSCG